MGDTHKWSGGKMGAYHLRKRYRNTGSDVGRIYEAHNVETGAFALVVRPGRAGTWGPRTPWTVRVTAETSPPFLALEVEHAPKAEALALSELTRMFIRLSGALACVEERADTGAHLTREPLPRPLRREASRGKWQHVGVGALAAVALVLGAVALWPRSPKSTDKWSPGEGEAVRDEPVAWVDLQDDTQPGIGYPMPRAPFEGQRKPPCLKGTEVELHGGCWVPLEYKAPCPKSTAELNDKCYMPVRQKPPEPRSLQP
jgi:hypothetical protein